MEEQWVLRNDWTKEEFTASLVNLPPEDTRTQGTMAEALGISLMKLRNTATTFNRTLNDYRCRYMTQLTKEEFTASLVNLPPEDTRTQKTMAEALGMSRTTFCDTATKFNLTLKDYRCRSFNLTFKDYMTQLTKEDFIASLVNLPPEDTRTQETMAEALEISRTTLYRTATTFNLTLKDYWCR